MTDRVDLEELERGVRSTIAACEAAGEGAFLAQSIIDGSKVTLALIAELRELRAGGWVSCAERMPGIGEQVAFVALGQRCVGYYNPARSGGGGYEWDDLLVVDMCGDCDHYSRDQVTHWMPLPNPPEAR